jgi:L-ribulokinase
MQIYADVLDMDIKIAGSSQNPALSSAIWGAVAAGKSRGGFDTVDEAIKVMANQQNIVYHPDPDTARIYDKLYEEYEILHDYFGRGTNDVMKRLKDLAERQRNKHINR